MTEKMKNKEAREILSNFRKSEAEKDATFRKSELYSAIGRAIYVIDNVNDAMKHLKLISK